MPCFPLFSTSSLFHFHGFRYTTAEKDKLVKRIKKELHIQFLYSRSLCQSLLNRPIPIRSRYNRSGKRNPCLYINRSPSCPTSLSRRFIHTPIPSQQPPPQSPQPSSAPRLLSQSRSRRLWQSWEESGRRVHYQIIQQVQIIQQARQNLYRSLIRFQRVIISPSAITRRAKMARKSR